MAETNAEIAYTAKRNLRDGVAVDDAVTIQVGVFQFTPSIRNNVKTAQSLGGAIKRSFYNTEKMWDVAIRTIDTALAEEFLLSVVAGERFYMTNVDEDDRIMTCELMNATWSYNRVSSAILNEFEYSFVIKEIPDA